MDSPRGRIHLISQILDSGAGHRGGGRAFRPVPRLHGLRDGVPVGCAVRPADRGGEDLGGAWPQGPRSAAEGDRGVPPAPLPARSRRDRAVRAAIFATFPYPAGFARCWPLRAAQLTGLDRVAARSKLLARLAPEAVAALAVAPPPTRAPAGPARSACWRACALAKAAVRDGSRPRASARRRRHAHRVRAAGLLPAGERGDGQGLVSRGLRCHRPPGQGCCGALSLHGGRRAEAAAFASKTIATFEQAGVDAVIVNAAGCGSAMKEYGHLLAGGPGWADRAAAFSAKVRDFSEYLAELGPVAPRTSCS